MDLDLDIAPRTRGRPPKAIECEIVREINQTDLALLDTERGVQPTSLKRIRDSHHTLARLIAMGLRNHEIAAASGYSPSRISILQGDPAFQDLVQHYRQIALDASEEVVANTATKLAAIRDAVADVMLERVTEEAEALSVADLEAIGKFAADRSGFGPQSKSMNLNLNVGIADQLAARSRRTSLPGAPATALPSGEAAAAVRLPPPSVERANGEARRAEE